MPNFKNYISGLQKQGVEEEGTQAEENSPDFQTEKGQEQTDPQKPQPSKEPEKPKAVFNNDVERQASIGNSVQSQNDPLGASQQYEPEAGQNSMGADVTGRDWVTETGNSFMRGMGDHVIGGFGDIAQVVGAAVPGINMFDGNILSRYLQEKGSSIAGNNQVYMPEELQNPEFSIKTLADPQFWSKHGAEYIPQLAEFVFLSKGAGSLAKRGANNLAGRALKGGLVKNAKGTLKNSASKLAKGADELMEVAGTGKGIGKAITDVGKLTNAAGMAVENIAGGMASNIVSGLLNSAEAYNSRKDLVGENGEPIFNKEELSDIAAKTFSNNLMYMGIDILSWGMTYGNAGKILKQSSLMRKGKQAFNSSKNFKNISKAFTAKTSPTLRKLVSVSGKALQEGYEETFQETYESWAAMMAESDVMGTEPEYSSFMEFYNSKENEGTKTIAFALGALGGSVSGVISGINKDAERSRQLYNRTENLKTIFDSADEKGNEMQKFHMRETISDMVLQDKTDMFESYSQNLIKEGILSDEEVAKMKKTIDDYMVLDNQAEQLNIRGKHALFQNHSTEMFFQEQVEVEQAKLENVIEVISNSNLTEQQKESEINKRTADTKKTIQGLSYGIAQSQANKANLILGKAVENVVEPISVKNEKGQNIIATGLAKADYKYFVEKANEDILKKRNQAEVLMDNAEYDGVAAGKKAIGKISELGNKAKSLFGNLFNKDKDEQAETTQEAETTEEAESQREDDESTSPPSPIGQGPNGDTENDGDAAESVQGEENGDNESGESENITGEVSDDISEDELNELGDLEEEAETLRKPKKKESKEDSSNRKKRAEEVANRISELADKAKAKVDKALPKGLAKETYDNIVAKIKGQKPLSTKEQEVVDKFNDTFDKVKETAKDKTKQFQNFVNKQADPESEVSKEVKKKKKQIKSQATKIKKKISKAIDDYKKASGPYSGMESRGEELAESNSDLSEQIDEEDNTVFIESNRPLEENRAEAPIIGRIRNSPSDLDKMVAINQRLNFMFPKADSRVNAYILDDLVKALGIRGAGLSVSAAVFVRSNEWNQGEVFMHEMTHIFYKFAKDRPETKAVLEQVMANKKLVNEIASFYPDYVLYNFGVGDAKEVGTFSGVPTDEDLIEYAATILPLAEQKYILEEAFVATMQGPLSKKYNKFFGLNEEVKRTKSSRKWWKMIDTKAKSEPTYLQESQELIQKLNDGQELSFDNMRDYIVMEFLKEVPRIEASEIGFESRSSAYDANVMQRRVKIKTRLEEEVGSYVAEENKNLFTKKEDSLDQILDEVSDNQEDADYVISIAEKSFMTRTAKATKIINNFVKEYNRAIRLRKTIWGKQGPLFDKKEFKYKIFQLASNTSNSVDFIDALENSPHADIQAFNKFLELRAPEAKTVLLNSTWTLFSNYRMVNAVKSVMSGTDGNVKHSIEESLSKREQSQAQSMMDNMAKAKDYFINDKTHLLADQWAQFETIIAKVKDGTATNNDYIKAYRFMAPPGVKMMDILENGFINVKGTYYSPVTVLKSFVDNDKHLGKAAKNGNRYIYPYNFRPIANAIMATNREFTQDSVVENAKGNMVPVRMMNNHMTKELDQMYDSLRPDKDGNVIPKADFIKRYSHITRSKAYSKPVPNQFLDGFYDSVIAGNKPDLVYYTGIDDSVTNNANAFEDSTSYEQSFEDFMMYASGLGKKTYLANVGVFGDSPRKYYMPTKRLDMSNEVNTAAYNIYRNISGDDISRRQFELNLKAEMKKEKDFFNKNGKELMKIESLKSLFDKNGKLTKEGGKVVNGYVYNQTINGLFMSEVVSPNIKISSVAKRLKNAGSPVISVNKNLKFEPIFFKDPKNDEASTDGGMFILREDAERWANAGKGVFDLNEGFKFLNYSVEKDNPNFRGNTVLLKGYTTIIDQAFVDQNYKFKGLYEHMKARRAKMFEAYAKNNDGAQPSQNFTDGLENYFPIAIPFSSEKTGIQKGKGMENAPYLNELMDEEGVTKAGEFQDGMMYNAKGGFMGISGYNFGPQQVMDKITDEVTLPVQQMNSLLVHALNLGHREEAEAIQELISEMMTGNLEQVTNELKKKDIATYEKIVTDAMNKEDMDQVQRFVIEKYGILHPRAIDIVSNQLANTLKSKGNKLRIPGTYAHQKSAYGWELPVDGEIKGSNELNGYSQSSTGLNRAEIVLPRHLEGKVRARKYYTLDSKLGDMATSANDTNGFLDKTKTPQENDLMRLKESATTFVAHLNKNKDATTPKLEVQTVLKEGKVIGYYVPGETVIATRVPSNGPNFTGIFEAVEFTVGNGNQVQVPTSFSKTIGADLDGDALFIQHKGKSKKMNEVIDRMEKLWLSEKMAPFIQTAMDTTGEGKKLKEHINTQFPNYKKEQSLAFSPADRRKSYEDSMIAKRNIGTVFNLHRMANTLAAYRANMKEGITVNGENFQVFEDLGKGDQSRNHKSALVANLILDNLNENAADALNINEHTVSAFTLMVNLNIPIEDVATMMNAPMVKEYVSIMNENNSAFHGYTPRKQMLTELANRSVEGKTGTVKYDANSTGGVITNALNKDFYSKSNQSNIINLIMKMDTVNADIQQVSKIMAGHNGIETNPYLLEKQVAEFKRIMNNDETSTMNIPADMAKNPDLKRYLATAEATLEHTKQIDLVYRPAITKFLEGLATKQGMELLNDNQIKKYTRSVSKFLHAHISGYNDISKEELSEIVDPKNANSVFADLSEYIAKIKMEGNLENNLLLTQGLNMKFDGNKPYISMNSSFFDESLTTQEVRKMNKEFTDLPADLQYKLVYYDLTKNGWGSPLSMLPITDSFTNQILVNNLNEDFKNKNDKSYTRPELRELEEVLMLKDINGPRNNIPFFNIKGLSSDKATIEMQKNPQFKKALENNSQFYFKSRDAKGVMNLYKFIGNKPEVFNKPISNSLNRLQYLAKNGTGMIKKIPRRTNEQLDIDLVTITAKGNPPIKKKAKPVAMESRSLKEDIDHTFKNAPDLGNIGTKGQYAAYLKSIFPKSTLNQIVYHGTSHNFDNFSKRRSTREYSTQPKGVIYFSSSYEGADQFSKEMGNGNNPKVMPTLLNIENPFIEDMSSITRKNPKGYDIEQYYKPGASGMAHFGQEHNGHIGYKPELYSEIIKKALKNKNDGVFLLNAEDVPFSEMDKVDDYMIFDPKQAYSLGTKKDKLGFKKFVDSNPNSKVRFGEPLGMESREEFWDYKSQDVMDRQSFNDAMEFNKFQTQESKAEAYQLYVDEKTKANEIYNKRFRGKDFNNFSPEKLMELYRTYGSRNAYAYANITTPIVKALAAKISAQQSQLTGRTKTNEDLNPVQTWLMSNNIPSNHPEIQGMVRNMTAMEKDFQNEKKKYVTKINDTTNALYKEKFGFMFNSGNPIDIFKRFYYSYIHNRKNLYNILYGNIVEENEIVSEGKVVKEFKLKSNEEINKLKEQGRLSEAEYNFYKMFTDVTSELAPYSTTNGKKVRRGYIPHTSMGTFESFANRGLLGLLQNSKSSDDALNEVMMYTNNPDTGKKELVSFKDIDNVYSAMSASTGNNAKKIKEYIILKNKAKKLLKSGKNEDGSDIQVSSFEMDSALSFGLMNRFANSRSGQSAKMPSMDLNHALNTYVHSTLFVNGNENFAGFKTMQAVVDGVLALNQDKGLKNAGKYVKMNWKDYYLKGKRQNLLGERGDKVVDLLTKMNLFWQLGFEASYVMGNIASGKYHNIKNGSVKEWAKGESRFWGTDTDSTNPFDIVKRFKRTQKILKTLNFMDINVYDNVSMSSKGRLDNFLGDLALMPMTWSEKWIQGVQMAGMLTEAEWNKFDDNGDYKPMEAPIDNQRLSMLEDEVKKSQGKGYQATDQRLIQQYSLGRMMLQFSRFLPTVVNDRFAKQDIDIYGKEHIGSLRMVFKTVAEVQSMNPKDYIEYRRKLQKESPELAKRLDSGLKGLAMSGLIGGFALGADNDFAKSTYWDANYYMDLDKIEYKLIPSAVRTTKSMIESIF